MMRLLLAILAFFLPPVAVFIKVGLGADFWINLVLTIFLWLPGVIHAMLIVFDAIPTRSR
jgi:uncharacterized membrane protein YqaE (UPF0057 family)